MAPRDNFKDAIERIVWAHSHLSTETRAEVLREVLVDLEADESKYDDTEEHVKHTVRSLGFELPEEYKE